ncbi:hypothetical protein LCGC14_0195320 [marine sediment metagenome]|uniref:Uncharacterized protein n=1 Tax=marine sediment metagenome TaxID=412755 RepID=A0A0F9UPX9_9ZZZZ
MSKTKKVELTHREMEYLEDAVIFFLQSKENHLSIHAKEDFHAITNKFYLARRRVE